MKNDYCVYLLQCLSTGNFIYVGSGTRERAEKRTGRNVNVQNYLAKNHVKTVVVASGLTKSAAEDLEQEYLDRYLGNIADGFNLLNIARKVAKTKAYDYQYLDSLFYYDPTSPTFLRWKIDRFGTGKAKIVKQGDIAGYLHKKSNRAMVSVDYKMYQIHRVIYSMLHKLDVDPSLVIDHIDRNPSNNCIENLRLVNHSENTKNRCFDYMQSNNTSGVKGIRRHKTEWNEYWSAHYKGKVKYFNINKYGEELAYQMAVKAREDLVKDNKE